MWFAREDLGFWFWGPLAHMSGSSMVGKRGGVLSWIEKNLFVLNGDELEQKIVVDNSTGCPDLGHHLGMK